MASNIEKKKMEIEQKRRTKYKYLIYLINTKQKVYEQNSKLKL